ncbi:proline-rich protein 7 isoform X2 [Sarcophilus harrisii]|uniref:Proline rich 7, synaptic n=1 Tax=Sarcophilus harrisii TaxID=9305 RepID=A0A7N4NSB9_SARHA|nr:proline-rich protein 7 isoform X2 [Sarcophilus harrisii]XP_031809627.1 proline-rich protein 7 isoform X2 [Sarcophilus harrisii]XP_031809628.1 proline-rich protein 7 isoform X2 [Sarcophilus harrisii]
MVMSQGTYTFLTCFAGFWLIWGLVVLLCCFCSFLRRRLKRRHEERLREQNLRALELEPLEPLEPLELEGSLAGSPPGLGLGLAQGLAPQARVRLEAPGHTHPLHHSAPQQHQPHPAHHHPHPPHSHPHSHPHPPHVLVPPRPWSYPRQAESDLSKPPCYEEAVLMAEPPPPYSEVLTDTRGLYRKIVTPFLSRDSSEKQEQPPNYKPLFLDRGYSSALHLPSAPRPGPPCPALYLQTERSRRVFPSWTDSELSNRDPLEHGAWRLPVSIPLFGRTTAV